MYRNLIPYYFSLSPLFLYANNASLAFARGYGNIQHMTIDNLDVNPPKE